MQIPCEGMTIALDNSKGDISFLSHAHSDHLFRPRKDAQIISSQETLDLARIPYSPISHPKLKMVDAGHILGAKQLVIDVDEEKIIYTGDFSTRPNVFGFKAEVQECDHLIMEATYGDPQFRFSSLEKVYENFCKWIASNSDCNIILGCYELGKAQELVKLLNLCGVAPIINEKMDYFCSVYERYGINLDRIIVGSDEAEEIMMKNFVALVPMRLGNKRFAKKIEQAFNRRTLCAVVTGWCLNFSFNADAAFPISNHADFSDLVDYVQQTGAKKVEFFCGDGRKVLEAANLLNKMSK